MRFGNKSLAVTVGAANAVSKFASKLKQRAHKLAPSSLSKRGVEEETAGGLATAADHEAAGAAAAAAEERAIYDEAERMFRKADVDGSGRLSMEEVRQLGVLLGFTFSHAELTKAMAAMDQDSSGVVEFQEFYTWWIRRKSNHDDFALHNEALAMFNKVDQDGEKPTLCLRSAPRGRCSLLSLAAPVA
eukprot:COSAG01_NODE_4993_length_4560_cov_31.921991_5_plen_188_part_00